MHTGRQALGTYHGKVIQFFVSSPEAPYVLGCQLRVIHQFGVDDVLIFGPGFQHFSGTP
jgi:hypothetical protein